MSEHTKIWLQMRDSSKSCITDPDKGALFSCHGEEQNPTDLLFTGGILESSSDSAWEAPVARGWLGVAHPLGPCQGGAHRKWVVPSPHMVWSCGCFPSPWWLLVGDVYRVNPGIL